MDSKKNDNTQKAVLALQGVAERIRQVEAQAGEALFSKDEPEAYRQKLREKTMLLMELPEKVEEFLEAMPKDAAAEIKAGVDGFAGRASRAWELSSIFYMSALLYPEDYEEGQMNDLERFIDRLRSRYAPLAAHTQKG